MEKVLYIIPAWEDSGSDSQYQLLAHAAKKKGYEIIAVDVDWTKPLSPQVFSVPKEAVLFGFSLGAILAWLVAQKYPCRHLILASMTPHYSFVDPMIKKALVDLAGKEFVDDIVDNLKTAHQAEKQTIVYGDREEEPADILVPDTEHELNSNYVEEIEKIL